MKKKHSQPKRNLLNTLLKLLLIPVLLIFSVCGGFYFLLWYEEATAEYIELDLELVGYPYNKSPWWEVTHSTRDFSTGKQWIVRYESSICLETECGTFKESLDTFDRQFKQMNWVRDDPNDGSLTNCDVAIPEMKFWSEDLFDYRVYIPAEEIVQGLWSDVAHACILVYKSEIDSPYIFHIVATINPSPVARYNSGL